MRLDRHAWHSVLLEAHGRDEEAVNDVLCSKLEVHYPAHRYYQGRRDNIVAAGRIGRIDAQRIGFIWLSEFGGISGTEHGIGPWVAEIPLKLSAGDFHCDLIGVLVVPVQLGPEMAA